MLAANQNFQKIVEESPVYALCWFRPDGPNTSKGNDPNNQDIAGLSFASFEDAVTYAVNHPKLAMAGTFTLYEIKGSGKKAHIASAWEIDDLGAVEKVS